MNTFNKTLLVVIPLLLAVVGFNHLHKYESINHVPLNVVNLHTKWIKKYNKSYSNPEEQNFRLRVFHDFYLLVTEHNSNPNAKFTMELNKFADMTDEEIKVKFLMSDITAEQLEAVDNEPRATAQDARNVKSVSYK